MLSIKSGAGCHICPVPACSTVSHAAAATVAAAVAESFSFPHRFVRKLPQIFGCQHKYAQDEGCVEELVWVGQMSRKLLQQYRYMTTITSFTLNGTTKAFLTKGLKEKANIS